jgi:hypothetical protein
LIYISEGYVDVFYVLLICIFDNHIMTVMSTLPGQVAMTTTARAPSQVWSVANDTKHYPINSHQITHKLPLNFVDFGAAADHSTQMLRLTASRNSNGGPFYRSS